MGYLQLSRAPEGFACQRCGRAEVPVAEFAGGAEGLPVRLCLYCLGEAIETITGWRMVRMVAQMRAISEHPTRASEVERIVDRQRRAVSKPAPRPRARARSKKGA